LAVVVQAAPLSAGTLGPVSTKDIRTSQVVSVCDVCGRTLLRGERAEFYLSGSTRRSVCELCKSRALHEGWVREGTLPAYDESGSSTERRRSLLSRLRARREATPTARPSLDDELDVQAWAESRAETPAETPAETRAERRAGSRAERRAETRAERRAETRAERRAENGRSSEPVREPRHVRAVPTSAEQKIASAVELFNGSEHRRTVAGVARSLGAPTVSVLPSGDRLSLVNIVASWELCWYRYEVELSDDQPTVRVSDQGYELEQLPAQELQPNAAADENGSLSLAG
jgi:hypothetical protein